MKIPSPATEFAANILQSMNRPRKHLSYLLTIMLGFVPFGVLLSAGIFDFAALAQSENQQPDPPTHYMQPGETLRDIAEKYGVTEDDLREFNGMTYVDFVFVGQPLLLPIDPETFVPDPSIPTPTPTPLPVHVVETGETLSQLAKSYGVSQAEFRELNGISNTDQIYIGQELRIPPANVADNPASNPDVDAEPVLPSIPHTVKRGETLSEIAKDRGALASEVMALNGISDPDAIYVGQVLEMPPFQAESAAPEPTLEPTIGPNPIDESLAESIAITATLIQPEPSDPTNQAAENPIQFAAQNLTTSLNRTYKVRNGDSLNRIALRNSVDLDTLMALNRLAGEAASALVIGQTLILPATERETMAEREPANGDADNEDVENAESDENVYIVQPGDNLSTIASVSNIKTALLMSANGITNPDTVFVGQRLVIPPEPVEEPETQSPIPLSLRKVRRGYDYYNVNPGDTLSQIASQFDTTVMALVEYNGLPDEETVFKGLELRIPYGLPIWDQRLPPSPASGSHFIVSISRQECWLLRGDYIDKAWRCSTGYGEWTTRLGSFQVKTRMELAQSSAHEMDMPYWLGIYDVGAFENGIHGLPVRWSDGKKVWSDLIGSPATYGCAMLNDDNASELFEESYLGMQIHIVE